MTGALFVFGTEVCSDSKFFIAKLRKKPELFKAFLPFLTIFCRNFKNHLQKIIRYVIIITVFKDSLYYIKIYFSERKV